MNKGAEKEDKANHGRWLTGWLIRLCGSALLLGLMVGLIGAFQKWGLNLPSTTKTTIGILGLIGALFVLAGQLLMNSAARTKSDK